MTVTKTNIATILARLEKVEARQNLLKDNLLSLKKQVDTLAATFQNRPELEQVQSIQNTLNELAQFGAHLDSSASEKRNRPLPKFRKQGIPQNGIDPDVLVMPLLDDESELEAVFDNDLGADFSTLLDTMDIVGGDASFGDFDLDDPLDDELGDRLADENLDIDNLDLENISLDELEQLDLYGLGDLGESLDNPHALSETLPQDFEARDLRKLESFDHNSVLENGQIGKLNDTVVELSETNGFDTAPADKKLNIDDFELDPVAMNALDLADLSDLDADLELDNLGTDNFDELVLNEDLVDFELPDEPLTTSEVDGESPNNVDFLEPSNSRNGFGHRSNPDLNNLAIAADMGALDLNLDLDLENLELEIIDNLDLEVATEMDDYDNLLSPDYDELLEIDTASPIPDIAARLIDPPAINPPVKTQPETEPTPTQTEEDGAETPLDQTPMSAELIKAIPEEQELIGVTPEDERETTPPATVREVPTATTAIAIRLETLEEESTSESEMAAIANPAPSDEQTKIFVEIANAEAPAPLPRQPIIDTESPEELAIAAEPPAPEPQTDAAAPQAELTAAEIMTRIDNHQHYFIGFQLVGLQLAQQNLRDCVFDTSNLQNSHLQNSDLRDSSFKSCNLTAANLEYTSLERASFEQANLAKAKLQGILFNSRTSFLGANLEDADFSYLDLTHPPDFKQANLQRTKFVGVNLRGVNCKDWNLTGANLQRANLIDADLRDANLKDADLTGAIYSAKTIFPQDFQPQGALLVAAGANLSQQNFHNHDLSKLDLTKVNFSGANLEHANLNKCDLSDANFNGANLRRSQLRATCLEANFENANLTQADLSEANVTGSNFSNANCQAATLKNANFTMADLRGTQLTNANTYRMNCNGANLENMDLSRINFEGDLSGANLTRAKLCNLNCNYLDLSWANLTDADLTGATFKETNLDNANLRGAIGFDLDSYNYKIYLNNTILPGGNTLD